jgi:RNA polymerase sigma-70 factor (ECF subfamily)
MELVAAAIGGSGSALTEILRRNQTAVRAFLRRVCGNPTEADDLAQDTFITAFARLDKFRGESSLRVWLCGIAYNKALVSRRSEARRRQREQLAIQGEEPGAPRAGGEEAKLDIQAAFATLTLEQRAAAALCLASDMSHSEAAAALGLPLGTLKSRVASARRLLVAALEDYR